MRHLPLILLLLISSTAPSAELSLSLPLGPYYRPGKYIPVQVSVKGLPPGNDWIGLAADNVAAATDIPIGSGRTSINIKDGQLDAVVPWFVMDSRCKRPRLFIEYHDDKFDGPDLKPLGESERLVGWTTPDESFARKLVGAPRIIPVPLDPATPIKGHPMAWEMLDAIILDQTAGQRLDQSQIASLLACGVTVAIKTPTPPLPGWPWKRVGEYAVLRYVPAGPATTGYHEAAFLPIADWQAGWPWSFRRQLLLIASLICLPLLALALWRPPLMLLWFTLVAGAIFGGFAWWWGTRQAFQQQGGEIVILNDGITQTDGWTYQTAAAYRNATLRWNDASRPILASRSGLDDIWLSMNCDVTGRPYEFHVRIPPNRKVAFLSRSVGPRAPQTPPNPTVTSALKPMIPQLYLQDGGQITGELPGTGPNVPSYGYVDTKQWNAVIIDRRTPPATQPTAK